MKKTIRDVDVKGKRIFCRADFNIPMKDGKIVDETRILCTIPTIRYLIDQGAKVILASHLGRPKGQVIEDLRMTPIAECLSKILAQPVHKVDHIFGPEVDEKIASLKNGDVLLLENLRFDIREEKNDLEFAKKLASYGEIFVCDAFGAAHRAHASISGIAGYVPCVAGFLMEKEIEVLSNALNHPKRPFTAIVGGSKVKDKIGVIDRLLDKVDSLIIGGGLAYTFLKAKGYEIGNSLLEEDKIELAKGFIKKAEEKGVRFCMPVDTVVADGFSETANTKTVDIDQIPLGWMGLDIGPKTIQQYVEVIKNSSLVIWNGPMGVFEMEPVSSGTKAVAMALATSDSTYSVIGGGDSAAAAEKFQVADQMDHISTGGGASLEFMEGKKLPGIEVLQDKE